MASMNESTSYDEFMKIIKDQWFKDWIHKIIEFKFTTIIHFRHEAFSTKAMFEDFVKMIANKKLNTTDIATDLTYLLAFFHIKGPILEDIKGDNIKWGGNVIETVQKLVAKYDIKSNSVKENDFTLPRLSMLFATLSYNVYIKLENKLQSYPVTALELGLADSQLFFPNFTPSMLDVTKLKEDDSGTIFFIHNIYQCLLSKKTHILKKNRKFRAVTVTHIHEFFADATKYAHLACTNSMTTPDNFSSYLASIKPRLLLVLDHDKDLKNLIKNHFNTVATEMLEPVTKYHLIFNLAVKTGKPMSDLADLASNSYQEIETEFNSN